MSLRALAALCSTGMLALAYACTLTDITGVPVGSVSISPASITLAEGATVRLSAQARDQMGDPLPVGGLTWSVARPELLSISETGLVEALLAGETTVRATLAGVSATAPVVIEPGPTITVETPSLSFTGAVGPTPPDPATIQITNTGGGVLGGLSASVSYAPGGPTGWLSPSLAGTTAPTNLTVAVLSGSLNQGTYSATISLASSAARNSPVSIPVQLTLALDQPLIAVNPEALEFVAEMGATQPDAKVVQVTNIGGGSLTNLQVLVASGSWLSASLSSPNAPSDLTIRPDPTGLAIGTYEESVLVRSSVALNEEEVAVTFRVVPVPKADLAVVKDGPIAATVGDTVVFVLTVSNQGPDPARGIVLADSLPDGLTFLRATGNPTVSGREVRWTLGALADQESSIDTVWATATGNGKLTNVARVTGTSEDASQADNRATHDVELIPVRANLAVEKTGPTTAEFGQDIQYRVRVVNGGPNAAKNVVLTDSLPPGTTFMAATEDGVFNSPTVTWNLGTLASGEEFTAAVSLNIGATGNLTNVVTAKSTSLDPALENNRATVTTVVETVADLSMVKTVSPGGAARVGEELTYTLTVTNNGPGEAASVAVSDLLPAGVSFQSATTGWSRQGNLITWDTLQSLALGVSRSYAIKVRILATGTLKNTASVASPFTDPDLTNNEDSVETLANPAPLSDLSVVKTGPVTATAGDQATYTITVTNGGPDEAVDVLVTDIIPSGTIFSSSPDGGTETAPGSGTVTWPAVATLADQATQDFTVVVDIGAGTIGAIVDTAYVSTTTADPVSGNDTTTFTTTVGAGSVSPGNSTATVPGGNVGNLTTITVQARDTNDNPLPMGGSTVIVTVTGSNTAGPITALDNGDGSYTASYTPSTVGTDNVAITLDGGAISGSPYSSVVGLGIVDAAQSTASVPDGTAGSSTTVITQARDSGGNPLSTGGATVVVSVTGVNTAGPITATDNGNGTYTASYMPTGAGTDNVAITLNGGAISGSPYSSTVGAGAVVAGNSIATVPNGAAGSPTPITVQARDANNNDLTVGGSTVVVTVSGTNTAGPTTATDNGDGTYSASYTPGAVGIDLVAITLGGTTISGSPYSSAVVAGTASAGNSTATVPAGTAGSATTITVQARDSNGNDLSGGGSTVLVTVSGANTEAEFTATDNADGTYTANYTPTATGTDDVDITLDGSAISGSPYSSVVSPGAVSAGASTATVPGGVVGDPTTITVQAKDANGNDISGGGSTVLVTVSGANTEAEFAATDNADGTYTASYTPSTVGTDNVAITLDAGAISGSPYSSLVATGGADASQSTAVVSAGTAGSATTITVQARDSGGNALGSGGETVVVTVSGDNAAGPITATDNSDGTYTASYIPTTAGTDAVAITLGGSAISGSPYSSTVGAGAASATNSTATVPDGTAGSPTSIIVQAKDANDNDLSVGGSTVLVTVSGDNAAGPITATDNADGSYTASYTPTAAGTDDVVITLGGTAIVGSPFSSTVDPGAASAGNTTATVPDGTVGVATSITIQAKDANDNDLSLGGSTVLVTVSGDNTAGPITATDNADGTYTASYTPSTVGTDAVAITLGGAAISGSPYSSTVSTGGPDASQSTATVPAGASASVTTVTVQARDSGGNDLSTGGASVIMTVSGDNTAGPTTATDNGDGTYTASYTPKTAGTDNVAITLNGVAISGSPYASAVSPGPVNAARSVATFPDGTAGTATDISIQARDANDNDLTVGGETVEATISGANTAGPISAVDNGNGTYTASYTPMATGTDDAAITLGGVTIRNSPYSAAVVAGAASAGNSTATVPGGTAGSPTTITVQAKDTNDNDLPGGGSTVLVTISGSNTDGPITATDNADGSYTATYTPTTSGTDDVAITLDGGAISGSPYSSTVVPGLVSAAISTASVPDGTAGSPTTITVQAKDANGNNLSAGGSNVIVTVSGVNIMVPTTATDNLDGTYSVTYSPTASGTDNVAITLDGGTISGSPYTSTVSPGAVSAANSTANVPDGTVGSTTTIIIQAKDANNNNLAVGGSVVVVTITGVNPGTPSVTDNNDGTYTAAYDPTTAGADSVAITLDSSAISASPYSSTVGTDTVEAPVLR